jgi:ClpP class serine protease
MGLDGKKWEEPEREFLRALVKKETGEFYDTVRRGRPAIAAEPIETANFYDGDQAVSLGLVDRNVKNIQQVIDAALAAHYLAAAAPVVPL